MKEFRDEINQLLDRLSESEQIYVLELIKALFDL